MWPSSATSLAISRSRLCEGLGRLGLKLILCFMDLRMRGGCECLFRGGSSPRPARSVPHSANCASSLYLISSAWSAIRWASLSSTCFSSSRMRPRSSRFSESISAHSLSSSRIRRARMLFDLASSLFCRSIFLRTIDMSACAITTVKATATTYACQGCPKTRAVR